MLLSFGKDGVFDDEVIRDYMVVIDYFVEIFVRFNKF